MSATRKPGAGLYALGKGVWLVRARLRVNGRITQRQARITGNREAARALLAKMKAELRQGGAGCSLTIRNFGEALSYYLANNDPGRSAPYFRRLAQELGGVPLGELRDRWDRWFLLMRSERGRRTGRPLAPGTLNQYLLRARSALNFCVRRGVLPENPLRHFDKLRELPRHVALTPEQERALRNVIAREAPHLLAFVEYSLVVPSRRSELTTARREQLDLVNNTLTIPAEHSKRRRPIVKPLPESMLSYFRALPKGCDWVFYRQGPDGTYLPLGDMKRAWRRCCRLAGLPGLRVHDLRHVAASRLHAAGVPEMAIHEVAGWSPASGMLTRYWGETPARVLEMARIPAKRANDCANEMAAAG